MTRACSPPCPRPPSCLESQRSPQDDYPYPARQARIATLCRARASPSRHVHSAFGYKTTGLRPVGLDLLFATWDNVNELSDSHARKGRNIRIRVAIRQKGSTTHPFRIKTVANLRGRVDEQAAMLLLTRIATYKHSLRSLRRHPPAAPSDRVAPTRPFPHGEFP